MLTQVQYFFHWIFFIIFSSLTIRGEALTEKSGVTVDRTSEIDKSFGIREV
jgi:hypothetical protein